MIIKYPKVNFEGMLAKPRHLPTRTDSPAATGVALGQWQPDEGCQYVSDAQFTGRDTVIEQASGE